ncbi:hypothetical protein OG892_20520 [Streptomyces sp. NBC_00341]|uniref:hypothetical protein n=1 Tax=Streptomyces sp. NBC_00341 TaxID=2975717 RepID=UPI00308BE62B|nr:hypothetical protein OG892_20520 [Streptomyces sp. NBC_00341]
MATEHIVKGFLASRSPALIAEDWNLLVHATGAVDLIHVGAQKPLVHNGRSIDAAEAMTRARNFAPGLCSKQRYQEVLRARNGVAHLGWHEESVTERVMATCSDLVDALLDELTQDKNIFWGSWLTARGTLDKAHIGTLRKQVEWKVARAKATFRERFEQPGITAPERSPVPRVDDDELVRVNSCSACGREGFLIGQISSIYGSSDASFRADRFVCGLCGLRLVVEEFNLLGLPESGPLTTSDVVDFSTQHGGAELTDREEQIMWDLAWESHRGEDPEQGS